MIRYTLALLLLSVPALAQSGSVPSDPYGAAAAATASLPSTQRSFRVSQQFQGGPRFGITKYIATGDSITANTGIANPADDYVVKIASKTGVTAVNIGSSGYQSEDWVRKEIFPNLNPTPANNPLVTALILHNDLHWCGTSTEGGTNANGNTAACLANAQSSMMAGLTWAAIPINQKVLGNTAASSGTWTADSSIIPNGSASGTVGASKTFTLTTTSANQAAYLWYGGLDGSNAVASVTLDGVAQTGIASAPASGQCICTVASGTETVWAQRYVLGAAGSHSLVVTIYAASGGSTIRLLAAGTAPVGAAPVIAPPSIFVGTPIDENLNANQASVDAYTAMLTSLVATLDGDGLLVDLTNTQTYQNVATDMSGSNVTVPNGMGDEGTGTTCSSVVPSAAVGQHPNICGHQHIADAFLAHIQPSPAPGSAALPQQLSLTSLNTTYSSTLSLQPYQAGQQSLIGWNYNGGNSNWQMGMKEDGSFVLVDNLNGGAIMRINPSVASTPKVVYWAPTGGAAGTVSVGTAYGTTPPAGAVFSAGPAANFFVGSDGATHATAFFGTQATLTSPNTTYSTTLTLQPYAAGQQSLIGWNYLGGNSNWQMGMNPDGTWGIFDNLNGGAVLKINQSISGDLKRMALVPSDGAGGQVSIGTAYAAALPAGSVLAVGTGFSINSAGIPTEALTTPASSTAACTAGQFEDDASFHYVCVAANTWKRVALTAF